MVTRNYDKEIAEIRAEIRKCERFIAQASTHTEAEMWRNIQCDWQKDLDKALTAKERKW